MADDKFTDPRDESTPENSDGVPGGAELADSHLPDPEVGSGIAEEAPELTQAHAIDDPQDTADDDYVDDPDTHDINEAKLDRATDAVADDEPVSAVVARKRNRANKPVRRVSPDQSAGDDQSGDDDEGEVSTKTVARKSEATRKRREAERKQRARPERTGPVKFVNEAVGELRKVVWPSGNQVQQYFIVVLVFVLFIIAFVSLLDLGFGWVILKVFG